MTETDQAQPDTDPWDEPMMLCDRLAPGVIVCRTNPDGPMAEEEEPDAQAFAVQLYRRIAKQYGSRQEDIDRVVVEYAACGFPPQDEFLDSYGGYFIGPDGRPITVRQFELLMRDPNLKHVGDTYLRDRKGRVIRISTAWLGTDLGHGEQLNRIIHKSMWRGGGKTDAEIEELLKTLPPYIPTIYETMVFGERGRIVDQRRYSIREEAEVVHGAYVRQFRRSYPYEIRTPREEDVQRVRYAYRRPRKGRK